MGLEEVTTVGVGRVVLINSMDPKDLEVVSERGLGPGFGGKNCPVCCGSVLPGEPTPRISVAHFTASLFCTLVGGAPLLAIAKVHLLWHFKLPTPTTVGVRRKYWGG
uniref:Uncharacterized protein n=1 Tax=Lutzomyia longipalpis TaxID=7200 RepID=A0A1B0CVX9_LUTLO